MIPSLYSHNRAEGCWVLQKDAYIYEAGGFYRVGVHRLWKTEKSMGSRIEREGRE